MNNFPNPGTDPDSFTPAVIGGVVQEHGTPAWIYNAGPVRDRIAQLAQFDTIRFAQKACSNIHILRLMKEQGVMVDAVSLGEVERALRAGYSTAHDDDPIVFTADVLDRQTLQRVVELGIPVNAGSAQMLEQLGEVSPGHRVWLRINPGFGHGHSKKTNTGGENSKHGIWHEQLSESLELVEKFGLDLVGLHMHIGSGVDYSHLERVCDAMVQLVKESGKHVRAISAGGGLSVPYAEGEPEPDTAHYFNLWDAARKTLEAHVGHPVRLEIEPGRFLVANAGILVSEVRAVKTMGANQFVLVDAGFNDLMRPALYGSHHRITVHTPDGALRESSTGQFVVAGPLCESGDVFSQDAGGEVRKIEIPRPSVGDLLVFHDAGAYGASMSSNYNSRPLAPEILVDGGDVRLIRRRQTMDELLVLEESAG